MSDETGYEVYDRMADRIAALELELQDLEKMRCPTCSAIAPENEKDWPNSECVVCARLDEIERLVADLAERTRELEEARREVWALVEQARIDGALSLYPAMVDWLAREAEKEGRK